MRVCLLLFGLLSLIFFYNWRANGVCYEKRRFTKYWTLLAGPLFFPWACTRASIPKVVGSIPTVAKHIFQACPVWIYTQSNITNIFTWVHNTNTEKKQIEMFIFHTIVRIFIAVFVFLCCAIRCSFDHSTGFININTISFLLFLSL
jgi:hypothetical protein